MPRLRSPAFSLVELLVTLGLLALLASLAMPSLNHYVQRTQQRALRDSLVSHLRSARSEAITQRRRIELCGSSTGQRCDNAWEKGWLIRAPSNADALRFTLLTRQETIRWAGASPTTQSITYQANGTTAGNNGRFVLCDSKGRVVWQLVLNRQGRVRAVEALEAGQRDDALCR